MENILYQHRLLKLVLYQSKMVILSLILGKIKTMKDKLILVLQQILLKIKLIRQIYIYHYLALVVVQKVILKFLNQMQCNKKQRRQLVKLQKQYQFQEQQIQLYLKILNTLLLLIYLQNLTKLYLSLNLLEFMTKYLLKRFHKKQLAIELYMVIFKTSTLHRKV